MNHSVVDRLRKFIASVWFAPISLLGILLIVFREILTDGATRVLSDQSTDLASEFYYWREFAFNELRHGHIAQWNPHVYGGLPFLGGWQAGIFYPPNWIYLVLPLNPALNLDIVISVFLAGYFTFLLARHYGLSRLASLLTGVILMLSGAFYPHIFAGHLATLATMAWVPLTLLAVDQIIERPNLKSVLLGAFSLTMQVLAGHPQTLFNTLVMLVLYVGIRFFTAPKKYWVAASLLSMGLIAFLISSAQLLPGLQINSEGTRADPVTWGFSLMFSLPPESLLSMLSPHFFGEVDSVYWGRWYYWEVTLFISVVALPLLAIGAFKGESKRRGLWITMCVLLFWIALYCFTPLGSFLYKYVPGFSKFRAHCKFIYELTIFFTLLVGSGFDVLLKNRVNPKRVAVGMCIFAGLIVIGTVLFVATPLGQYALINIFKSGMCYDIPQSPDYVKMCNEIREQVVLRMTQTVMECVGIGIIFWLASSSRRWMHVLMLISICEMINFASAITVTFDPHGPNSSLPAVLEKFYKDTPGDYRVLNLAYYSNSAMVFGQYDMWGYDPMVQRRYAEIVVAASGESADAVDMYARFRGLEPVFRVLRCKYKLERWFGNGLGNGSGNVEVHVIKQVLPHALTYYNYQLLPERKKAIYAVVSPDFDCFNSVVLQNKPSYAANPKAAPTPVTAVWKDSDTLEVTADTAIPGTILITDAYSKFWHAKALAGSAQSSYQVEAGDYALIAIPVGAGHHRILLNYCPPIFRTGVVISVFGLFLFLGLGAFAWNNRKREIHGAEAENDRSEPELT